MLVGARVGATHVLSWFIIINPCACVRGGFNIRQRTVLARASVLVAQKNTAVTHAA
jgi:hypothetical protein